MPRGQGTLRTPQEVDDFAEIKVGKKGVMPRDNLNATLMSKFPQLKDSRNMYLTTH